MLSNVHLKMFIETSSKIKNVYYITRNILKQIENKVKNSYLLFMTMI